MYAPSLSPAQDSEQHNISRCDQQALRLTVPGRGLIPDHDDLLGGQLPAGYPRRLEPDDRPAYMARLLH